MDHLTRLQAFFHSPFQFDLADLDFGLYRLFRLKQEEIEAFIGGRIARIADGGAVWDQVLINDDSPTPRVSPLDPLFKRLLMAGEAA